MVWHKLQGRTFSRSNWIYGDRFSYLFYRSPNEVVNRLWLLVVSIGFILTFLMTFMCCQDWTEEPISTSVVQIPIEHIIFPAVTICPLGGTWNSFVKLWSWSWSLFLLFTGLFDVMISKILISSSILIPKHKGPELHILHLIFQTTAANGCHKVNQYLRFQNWIENKRCSGPQVFSQILFPSSFWPLEAEICLLCSKWPCDQIMIKTWDFKIE